MKELARHKCPACGSVSFTADPAGSLICNYCHAAQVPSDRVCPVCGAAYDSATRRCLSCDADLSRKCPACSALNPPFARECLACGQRLEILDSLFTRVTGMGARWLGEVRNGSPAIKAQQEAASQARLAGMWGDEMRRREALAQAEAERDRQESIIVTATVIVVAIFIVVGIVALAIAIVGAPGS